MILSRTKTLSKYVPDLILFLIIIGLQIAYVLLFFSRERFVYFFDFGGFEVTVNNLAPLFPRHWQTILEALRQSLPTDYNYYYTLFLIPVARILGPSRANYLVGVVLLYQIPFTLAVGFLYSQLLKKRSRLFFWCAVFITVLIPNTWAPTVRGYPDVVGTLFICLAIGFYLLNYPEKKWWQYPVTGFLLAWSAIFRRYNLYGTVAFFLVAVIFLLVDFATAKKWRLLFLNGLFLALSGIAFLVTLYLFDEPFLINVITTNYYTLYSSYLVDIRVIFDFFVSQYGLVLWIVAIVGYAVGLFYGWANRSQLLFVMLWGIVLQSLWIFYVRQAGIHYTLSITIFIVIGIVCFLQFAITNLKSIPQRLLIGFLIVFIGVNFILTFDYYSFSTKTTSLINKYFSTEISPRYRRDYDEVMHLVDYLRTIAANRESIYVADSSYVMNYDIVMKAEQQRYPGLGQAWLNLILTPQVDSRDFYPLESLIRSDYVIVSSPLQIHLSEGDQRVVKYVYDAFQKHWEFTNDFVELPEQFHVGELGDVSLHIYKRVHLTTFDTALSTLKQMQAYLPQRPGSQKDWVLLTKLYSPGVLTGQALPYAFIINPEFISEQKEIQFLYIGSIAQQGNLNIELRDTDKNTPNLEFDLFVYDDLQKKNVASFHAIWTDKNEPKVSIPYSLDFTKDNTHLSLLFQVKKQPGDTRNLSEPINIEYGLKGK